MNHTLSVLVTIVFVLFVFTLLIEWIIAKLRNEVNRKLNEIRQNDDL